MSTACKINSAHSVSIEIYSGIARFPCDSTTLLVYIDVDFGWEKANCPRISWKERLKGDGWLVVYSTDVCASGERSWRM